MIGSEDAEGGAGNMIPTGKRTTTRYMTKYERARVLGTRALQIRCSTAAWVSGDCSFDVGSMGAPVMVGLQGETDPLDIAQKELQVTTTRATWHQLTLCLMGAEQEDSADAASLPAGREFRGLGGG